LPERTVAACYCSRQRRLGLARATFTPSTSTLDVLRATRETEQELEGIDQAIKAMPRA
jgi:hypothetical protein